MKIDLERVKKVVAPILSALGFELIELRSLNDRGRWILRVVADRDNGGVTVGDCQMISREVETPLEIEGIVVEPYALEVSSPGLERPLVKEADFVRFAGKQAVIVTREPINGRRNYKGVLKGIQVGVVEVTVDGQLFQIPFNAIARAHLVF